jgi:hypothetical protein
MSDADSDFEHGELPPSPDPPAAVHRTVERSDTAERRSASDDNSDHLSLSVHSREALDEDEPEFSKKDK